MGKGHVGEYVPHMRSFPRLFTTFSSRILFRREGLIARDGKIEAHHTVLSTLILTPHGCKTTPRPLLPPPPTYSQDHKRHHYALKPVQINTYLRGTFKFTNGKSRFLIHAKWILTLPSKERCSLDYVDLYLPCKVVSTRGGWQIKSFGLCFSLG